MNTDKGVWLIISQENDSYGNQKYTLRKDGETICVDIGRFEDFYLAMKDTYKVLNIKFVNDINKYIPIKQ